MRMGKHGVIRRALTREIGGLPIWALLVTTCVIGIALGVASSAERAEPAPFVAPSAQTAPALPKPMPLVVFLGDSYTQGVGGEGVTWPDLVGAKRGWDVANLGRGGTGYLTTSGTDGCGRRYCGTYAETSKEIVGSPRAIIISGGRNDIGKGTAKIVEGLDLLLHDLKNRYPDAVIMVLTPWRDDDPPPPQFDELAPAFKKVTEEHGVTLIDAGQPLADRSDLMSEDSVHPNANGYRALASAVEKAIAKIALP